MGEGINASVPGGAEGRLDPPNQIVVAVLTGHGLKDPDAVTSRAPEIRSIPAELCALDDIIN